VSIEQTLQLISKAWGRSQSGYCFFPWIDREEQARAGIRRAGYHEGPAFKWPRDKPKIVAHLKEHQDHDMYWCPSLFEYDNRRADFAMDEHALWADLDAADPRLIEDFPPTVAWETSPGRYQALWLLNSGDLQGASWPGNENQRLTYHIGADPSGWDTTQLLRVPGWKNHKPEYLEEYGFAPEGKLLWKTGRAYLPDEFDTLPEIKGSLPASDLVNVIEDEIDAVDRHAVIARVKLKLTQRTRDLIAAREAMGDRSNALWEMERSLADVGCTVAEIVAIVKDTPWNKFAGRADEIKRLILEASKALAQRPEEIAEVLEEERIPKPEPQRLGLLLANVKRPVWLVDGILTEGAVGFIAGEPKSYKSWLGLDLALSVATGGNFLDYFRVVKPGPVLYIQEEDTPTILKDRTGKIWESKKTDRVRMVDGELVWLPSDGNEEFDPDILAYIQQGFTISDGGWQEWLDNTMATGLDGEPFRLVVMDTLMMVAGDVDENRSQEMTTKIFKPMKQIMRKHGASLQVVHHMRKTDPRAGNGLRGGQKMLGSVANHAWSEDSMYLRLTYGGDIKLDYESKTGGEGSYKITNIRNKSWSPHIEPMAGGKSDDGEQEAEGKRKKSKAGDPKSLQALRELGRPGTVRDIADKAAISYQQAHRQLQRLALAGAAHKDADNKWHLGKG
jgi:hypothetical protein